jgi:hypothetical protein
MMMMALDGTHNISMNLGGSVGNVPQKLKKLDIFGNVFAERNLGTLLI